MWADTGAVSTWKAATSTTRQVLSQDHNRSPIAARISTSPKTWGLVAACRRVMTSGNRSNPTAADRQKKQPSTIRIAATSWMIGSEPLIILLPGIRAGIGRFLGAPPHLVQDADLVGAVRHQPRHPDRGGEPEQGHHQQ